MKRAVLVIMSFVMTAAMISCGSSKNMKSGNAVAVTSGVTCAKAITALNNSYKADGVITVNNSTDLKNMLTLITCYNQLKENKNNASYKQSFANGLISGSDIITSANATKIIDKLLNIPGLDKINAQNINQNIATVNTIISLIKTIK